jgi:cell division protein FtsB
MNSSSSKRRFLRVENPKYTRAGNRAPEGLAPVIIVVFVWLMICVFFSTQAVKYNYEVNDLNKQKEILKTTNRTLEYKMQAMMSGEKLAAVAKTRYGFKVPDSKNVFIVPRRDSIGDKIGGVFEGVFSKG